MQITFINLVSLCAVREAISDAVCLLCKLCCRFGAVSFQPTFSAWKVLGEGRGTNPEGFTFRSVLFTGNTEAMEGGLFAAEFGYVISDILYVRSVGL
jgi:hypothetical protein